MKNKTTKYLLMVFIFSLIISFLTPICGDDWGNYLVVSNNGIKGIIKSAYNLYFTWEGRFISRIFLNFFTYYKILWNILNAIQVTLVVYCAYKIIKPNNKVGYLLPILSILLLNPEMYTQAFLWLAGNMTYLTPTIITLLTNIYLINKSEYKLKAGEYILILTGSIITPMFVENIGCAYVISMLMWLIYIFFKEKRISKQFISFFLLSTVFLIIMLLSPGSKERTLLDKDFNSLNIFQKIYTNIPNLITYLFNRQTFMLLLMSIPINIMIYQNSKKLKIIKLIILDLFLIINIAINSLCFNSLPFTFVIGLGNRFNLIKLEKIITFPLLLIYWIPFGLLFIKSMYTFIKDKNELIKYYILLLTALISVGVMLLTPVWGDRVIVLCNLVITFISIKMIIDILPDYIIINTITSIVTILMSLLILAISSMNFVFDIRRDNQIKTENGKQEIILYNNRNNMLWNYNPMIGEYNEGTFREYKKIDKNTKLSLEKPSNKELIKFIIKGEYRKGEINE